MIKNSLEVETIILAIFSELERYRGSEIGLLNGDAGHLLFDWYFQKHFEGYLNNSYFEDRLETIQSSIGLATTDLSICKGITGVAWLFELILRESGEAYSCSFNDPTDRLLESLTEPANWEGEIEFILGISGLSPYASRRLQNGRGGRIIENIYNVHLSNVSFFGNDEASWETPHKSVYRLNRDEEYQEFNLGLAHGIPGIILSLIPAASIESTRSEAKDLILKASKWLIQQKNESPKQSTFGYVSGDNATSRLAWCYGDLGIAIALARAGVCLQNEHLKREALEIALNAATRDIQSSGVDDASICHGSSGIIMLFDCLDNLFEHPALKAAKQYWVEDILYRYKNHGLNGLNYYDNLTGKYTRDYSFLNGFIGIGLVLLTELDVKPDWSDVLLLQ